MMRNQMRIVVSAFWSPAQAVNLAAETRSLWLIQLLVLGMQGMSTALAGRFLMAVVFHSLIDPGRLGPSPALVSFANYSGYFSVALAVVLQLLFWHVTAAVLIFLSTWVGSRKTEYRDHLSLAVVGSMYGSLAPFHVLIVWHVKGVEFFDSLRETAVPIGLNMLPVEMSPFFRSLLGAFNIYQMCGLVYVAYGFSRLTGFRLSSSYCLLGGLWLLWTCVRAALGPSVR